MGGKEKKKKTGQNQSVALATQLKQNLHINLFWAKWLSHSFNRKILRKKKWGRRPSCPIVFWLLKKATRIFNFLRTFSLVKNMRN